jgi:hypothetical protein
MLLAKLCSKLLAVHAGCRSLAGFLKRVGPVLAVTDSDVTLGTTPACAAAIIVLQKIRDDLPSIYVVCNPSNMVGAMAAANTHVAGSCIEGNRVEGSVISSGFVQHQPYVPCN